jgi:hypothetical protein
LEWKDYIQRMRKKYRGLFCAALGALLACSSNDSEVGAEVSPLADSLCDSACDSSPLSVPVLSASGGYGAVTTYGNVSDPEYSSGGACNYGATQIQYYAAAHVNLEPGDGKGLWQSGHACGDCYRVRVGSDTGWRSVVVRIVDKCPDAYCGIDLGGAPAQALMGNKPGRYTGEWEWVSCASATGISDGPAVLHVKEGSNAWWALIQVRNGPAAVQSMRWESMDAARGGNLAWASEAENFWKVPDTVLTINDSVRMVMQYRSGAMDTLVVPGKNLGEAGTDWKL